MDLLMKESACVSLLSEKLQLEQYNVSKHLRILEQAGLLLQKKTGQKRIYSLADNISKKLSKDKNKLALGCCTFDFNRIKI